MYQPFPLFSASDVMFLSPHPKTIKILTYFPFISIFNFWIQLRTYSSLGTSMFYPFHMPNG